MSCTTKIVLPLLLVLASIICGAVGARIEDLASDDNNTSPLVWQPLRASFRPLNRQALPPPPPSPPPASELIDLNPDTTTTSSSSTTEPPSSLDEDDEQPTRVPLSRFRPTRPPSVDAQSQPANRPLSSVGAAASGSQQQLQPNQTTTNYRITGECFECICEASTSCNARSRCQTSDVRHTRCGLYLISYNQWLESGLSRQLVSREALVRDPAADERAFYECVTERECAERLLSIYMARKALDCDKDGRIDCYDVAAIHQGGLDQCASESLLESQYWSDFNACFGFGRLDHI